MIVRPDAISASKAPSTNPLNIWETRLTQLIMANLVVVEAPSCSGIGAEVAAEGVRRLHQGLARQHLGDVPEVLLVLHVARLLAAHDDHRADKLVIGSTPMDLAHQG